MGSAWGKQGRLSTCVEGRGYYIERPRPQPSGSRRGPEFHLLGQSPLLGPAADVAAQESQRGLVLDCSFSFTDWICSARHCSVGGGGGRAGQGSGMLAEGQAWIPGWPRRPGWGHEFAASKPMQLPPSLHGGPLCCPAVLIWTAFRYSVAGWWGGWGRWKPGWAGLSSLPDAPGPLWLWAHYTHKAL